MSRGKAPGRGIDHNAEAAANDEDEWLFESVVNFLSSPIWSIPIQHFFENNCTIFSPSSTWSGGALLEDELDDDNDNVPRELLDVHKKYKDLVDALINSFLQDLGISHSKFVRVCQNSSHFTQHPVYLELFEQVWCAENFKLFKAQMVRKNVELELQALVLLQYQLGIIKPGSHASGGSVSTDNMADDEIMSLVIKKSKDEYDAMLNTKQRGATGTAPSSKPSGGGSGGASAAPPEPIQKSSDMETAKKLSKSDRFMENLQNELDQQDYINKKLVEEELSPKGRLTNTNVERPMSASRKSLEIASKMQDMRLSESRNAGAGASGGRSKYNDDDDDIVAYGHDQKHSSPSKTVNHLAENILAQSENISESEIKRRAEFMKRQRDLLTERKRVERQKQLDQFMDQEADRNGGANARPMSSRAARKILSGADPTDVKEATSSSSRSDEERKRLESRKALAETLKKEVIQNSKSSK